MTECCDDWNQRIDHTCGCGCVCAYGKKNKKTCASARMGIREQIHDANMSKTKNFTIPNSTCHHVQTTCCLGSKVQDLGFRVQAQTTPATMSKHHVQTTCCLEYIVAILFVNKNLFRKNLGIILGVFQKKKIFKIKVP